MRTFSGAFYALQVVEIFKKHWLLKGRKLKRMAINIIAVVTKIKYVTLRIWVQNITIWWKCSIKVCQFTKVETLILIKESNILPSKLELKVAFLQIQFIYMFSFWQTKIKFFAINKNQLRPPNLFNNKKNTVYNVSFVTYGHLGKTIWGKILR